MTITITKKPKKKILVEIDRYAFERLADSLGFFRSDFLASLDRAEDDINKKRVKKLKSLKDLRK